MPERTCLEVSSARQWFVLTMQSCCNSVSEVEIYCYTNHIAGKEGLGGGCETGREGGGVGRAGVRDFAQTKITTLTKAFSRVVGLLEKQTHGCQQLLA